MTPRQLATLFARMPIVRPPLPNNVLSKMHLLGPRLAGAVIERKMASICGLLSSLP